MAIVQKRKNRFTNKIFLISGLLLFAGCSSMSSGSSSKDPTGYPVMQPSATPVVTSTPVPTATPAPTSTPIPTSTPAPTATPIPTPTPAGTRGEVIFSEADYFFTENTWIELSISSKKKTGYITYSMDGTEPTKEGTRYTEPLFLVTTDDSSPNVYSIRAKAWYDDGSESATYVHTYFLGETVFDRYSTIVFSINGDPSALTEGPDGILYGENYKLRGKESERPVHIEVLTAKGTLLFDQNCGARVFGGTSREHAVKSLKFFARKEYEPGKGTFSTTLFGSTTLDGTSLIKKYDKMVLRNGGDDFQAAFLRDELVHRLAATTDFTGYEAVVPALAYVNGSYYGLYWLHESYCDEFFQQRNGESDGEYVVLEGSDYYKSLSSDELANASAKEYNAFYNKYAYSDLTNEKNYQVVCDTIDVENYIDYMAFNMYVANYDWPQGNYRCFRYYAAEGEEYGTGETDGRWRYLLHDADVGFGCYQSGADAGASRNDIYNVLGDKNIKHYAPLLAALLKRDDCREYFINKMLEYRDVVFSYENVSQVLEQMHSEHSEELAIYIDYLRTFDKEVYEIYTSHNLTAKHNDRILSFVKQRPAYITKYMENFFGIDLPDPVSQ